MNKTTGAQRQNKRYDKIWDNYMKNKKRNTDAVEAKTSGDRLGVNEPVCLMHRDSLNSDESKITENERQANARLIAAAPETAAERDYFAKANNEEQIRNRKLQHALGEVEAERDRLREQVRELLAACKEALGRFEDSSSPTGKEHKTIRHLKDAIKHAETASVEADKQGGKS